MDTIICPENADQIWGTNQRDAEHAGIFGAEPASKMKVKTLCTTDDPLDDLRWHKLLKTDFEIRVLPAFRPDPVLNIEKEGYLEYLEKLAELTGEDCGSWEGLKAALKKTYGSFAEQGCKLSDHALNGDFMRRRMRLRFKNCWTRRSRPAPYYFAAASIPRRSACLLSQ